MDDSNVITIRIIIIIIILGITTVVVVVLVRCIVVVDICWIRHTMINRYVNNTREIMSVVVVVEVLSHHGMGRTIEGVRMVVIVVVVIVMGVVVVVVVRMMVVVVISDQETRMDDIMVGVVDGMVMDVDDGMLGRRHCRVNVVHGTATTTMMMMIIIRKVIMIHHGTKENNRWRLRRQHHPPVVAVGAE